MKLVDIQMRTKQLLKQNKMNNIMKTEKTVNSFKIKLVTYTQVCVYYVTEQLLYIIYIF